MITAGRARCVEAGVVEPGRDTGPVHNGPDGVEERSLVVLVLQVMGVLPGIDGEDRHCALAVIALMVVGLLDDDAVAGRFPRRQSPPRALDGAGRFDDVGFERREPAEVGVDLLGNPAGRFATAVGGRGTPRTGCAARGRTG